ncbi:hypothetical protein L210DRAFT_3574148 [Boletus edulis BED1]|uniref:Uncharacterized protein n=1 Tax=Boletus edulis BED1 TaxID=1328754 RepID=A0AAD4BDR9_BOLED|nr:hypothetical protein L210DRAFT_3574148 [Boletus edulis BED1]
MCAGPGLVSQNFKLSYYCTESFSGSPLDCEFAVPARDRSLIILVHPWHAMAVYWTQVPSSRPHV